ncbi:MAG: YceI family protein [Chloroflexota bacterium]
MLPAAPGGPLSSPLTFRGLDLGYRQLYSQRFEAAHQSFRSWGAEHPSDPLAPASDAVAYLFAEMDRLQILQAQFFTSNRDFLDGPKGTSDPGFSRDLEQSETLAARALAGTPNDVNALYSEALCHGLRADDLGIIQKRYFASLGEMKKGRTVAERVLALDPDYADAYLAVGIENYVLGLKSAPVRWLLRLDGANTDKAAGLTQLGRTAAAGHYLQPYAEILLALAALRDHDPAPARKWLAQLASDYPLNPLYARELARLDEVAATFDPAQTKIHFTLGAFLHSVHGSFQLERGSLQFDPATGAASGAIQIAAASGISGNAGRDRDMRQKVLEAATYPEIVFTPSHLRGQLARTGPSQVSLDGQLRIHGAEHDLTLPLQVTVHGDRFEASTAVEIPYVAWGIQDPSNALLRVGTSVKLQIATAGTIAWP